MHGSIKRSHFIQNYLDTIFADDLHAKRIASLANGTLGVMTNASLAVSVIGQSLAKALADWAERIVAGPDAMAHQPLY